MIVVSARGKVNNLKRNNGVGCLSWEALLIIDVFALFTLGCATPAQLLDNQAARMDLAREVLVGTEFRHVVYRNHNKGGDTLHVYLEGDGTPWLNRTWIAADPTPRNPLLLQLMVQDNAPSLYLGRPCYHGQSDMPPCNPLLWTGQRYSDRVVASMAGALKAVLRKMPYQDIVFIGHSGGGTLAMLLAEKFPQTRALVTLAGNLDPDRWAAWHGYSPLEGSLNPASRPPLPSTIVQLHYIGGQDKNIPAHLTRDAVAIQPCAVVSVLEAFDHTCCWESVWPALLVELESVLNAEPACHKRHAGK